MTRFASMAHGALGALVLFLPLLRLGWDQWAQTTVHLVWSFFIFLGSVLLVLGRSGDFSQFQSALRRWGPLCVVVLGASLLSSVLSSYPHSAYPGFLNDIPALGFLILAAGSSGGRHSFYSRALVGSGVLGVGIALLFRGNIAAPLLNPNLLAALVLLTGPLALSYGFGLGVPGGTRWFWMIGSGVLLLGLVFSHSLVAYGTGLLQMGVAVVFWRKRTSIINIKRLILVGGIGLFMGLGIFWGRSEWPKLFHGDPDRLGWWLTALRTFASHPLLGVGPGAFGEAYPAYRASEWGLNSLFAHNFFLEFLAERGFWGAGALFILIGSLLRRAWMSVREGKRLGLFLGLVGFCFYNLFHIGFSFPALFWLFFLAAGLAAADDVGGQITNQKELNGRKIPLLTAAFGLLWGLASFALFRSDQCLARARVFLSGDHWDQVQTQVEQGLFWNRWSPSLYEMRATLRIKAQDYDGAMADLTRAVMLAPSASVFREELAELAMEAGDVDRGLMEYEKVTRLMPLKPASWERWGDLLSGQGRKAEADRAYAGALRALSDPLVLGADVSRRTAWIQRVSEKRRWLGAEKK